jgi:hypothetical protein
MKMGTHKMDVHTLIAGSIGVVQVHESSFLFRWELICI